jgi:Tfp pilus assembly protein PilF
MPSEAQLLEVLRLDPDDPVTHFALGSHYRDHGQPAKAVEHFRRAAELKPGYSAAWFEMARTAEEHGDFEAARAAYRGAMDASNNTGDDHILKAARVRLEKLERKLQN